MEKVAGRRSLIALLQITTGREVAARCGVAPSRVSEWVSGLTRPSESSRARLWACYGISPNSWGDTTVSSSNARHTV